MLKYIIKQGENHGCSMRKRFCVYGKIIELNPEEDEVLVGQQRVLLGSGGFGLFDIKKTTSGVKQKKNILTECIFPINGSTHVRMCNEGHAHC